jgi:quercetin dioxygenase-like cupin family protein
MALPHLNPGEPVAVTPLGSELLAAAKSAALFKAKDLEVIRLVLREGKSLPPHRVSGEITVQCIEGSLDVIVDGRSHVLNQGQLMYLARGAVHAVTALEDATALLTVALRNEA